MLGVRVRILVMLVMLLLLLLLLLVILCLLLENLLLSQLLPVVVDLVGGRVVGSVSCAIVVLSINATLLPRLHGRNLGGCQKPSSWSTWASHCMLVARLVKVLAASLKQAVFCLQTCPGSPALEDAMVLLGVNIERLFWFFYPRRSNLTEDVSWRHHAGIDDEDAPHGTCVGGVKVVGGVGL